MLDQRRSAEPAVAPCTLIDSAPHDASRPVCTRALRCAVDRRLDPEFPPAAIVRRPIVVSGEIRAVYLDAHSHRAAVCGNRGRRGWRERRTKARLGYRRHSGRWIIVAGVVPMLAMLVAVVSARRAGDSAAFISANAVPSMIALQVITGAVGEEFGWRGFLLTRLSKRVGQMRAAWVMAMLWSLWHVPAWFDPALPHRTMPMIPTLSFILFFGVFLAFVFNRAGESVVATIAAHLSLNIMTGFGGVQLSSTVFWGALAAIFGVLAVLITLGSRTPPLGRQPLDSIRPEPTS